MSKKGSRRALIICIIVFAAILAALYIYIYLIPSLTGALTETSVVQYGSVKNIDEARCIVVRDEEVFKAKESGTVSCYVTEASKICKGVKVLDIYGENGSRSSHTCSTTSFVSFYTDGYEEYFTPDSIDEINPKDYADLNVVPAQISGNTVSKGDPVYKLIKSNTWYMLILADAKDSAMYQEGSIVLVNLTEDFSVEAKVSRILGNGDLRTVVLYTKHFYEKFGQLRTLDVTVITSEPEGLLIPTTSIAKEKNEESGEEEEGVYVLGISGEYTFKPVTVLVRGEQETLVKQDEKLKLYDEVLRNAEDH